MDITIESTDFEYFHSDKLDDYDLHCATACQVMTIDGVEFDLIYQTACSYLGNDYSRLNPDLELSDFGTPDLMLCIDALYEDDLTQETLDLLKEDFKDAEFIKTVDDLSKIRTAINDDKPVLEHFEFDVEYNNVDEG